MARLLLGVSGGIAAYKALEAVRLAVKDGHAVRVIQTSASQRFVGRASFEAITGAPVLSSEFEPDPARGAYPGEPLPDRAPISHLALVERAQLYLIAPATANTLAKLAHGHAEDLVSTAALAASCPIAVAPAMNSRMYLHPATQANLRALEARGIVIVPPGEGELASHGEHGIGRLADPPALLAACERLLTAWGPRGSWAGIRVLVTAGGTREPIDSVRFIGNRSSGRMGVALATRAATRGAEVTLIATNLAVAPPVGVRVLEAQTAGQLGELCKRELPNCDVLLMAAAVADFRPASPVSHKLKKDAGPPPAIELEATEDILSALAPLCRPDQVVVGFAAEHGDGGVEYGRGKLEAKGLDAVVVNDVSAPGIGFEAGENAVTILTTDGWTRQVPQASKELVADAVLDEVQRLREASSHNEEDAGGGARTGTPSAAGV